MAKYFFCFAVLIVACCHAADAANFAEVKAKASEVAMATKAGDFAKVIDMTLPAAVDLMGGRDNAIATASTEMKTTLEKGYSVNSIAVDDPTDFAMNGSEIYVVVPMRFTMNSKLPPDIFGRKSYLLAISADRGQKWFFVNGDSEPSLLKRVLPNMPADLKLPEREQLRVLDAPTSQTVNELNDASQQRVIALLESLKGQDPLSLEKQFGPPESRDTWQFNDQPQLELKFKTGENTYLLVMFFNDKVIRASFNTASP